MKNAYDRFFAQAKKNVASPTSAGKKPQKTPSRKSVKKGKAARKRRPSTPWMGIALMTAGLVVAGTGLIYIDDVDSLVSRLDIDFMGQATAGELPKSEKTAKSAATESGTAAKAAATEGASTKAKGAKWTAEELSFLSKLEDRKKQLDRREAHLNEVDKELQKQKKELDRKIDKLAKMRKEIAKMLQNKIQLDQKKIDKLVQFYSNMKPAQAAKIFEDINEDLAVEVLARMKKKNAANIMNLLKASKAQKLSEKFAGYRRQ